MGKNIAQKIISSHLVSGKMSPGSEIGIRIDQTLVHDATGQMALLQYEAIGVGRVKTRRSVTYADHNTLQVSFENMDDHHFLASASRKFGLYFSRVGQRHLPPGQPGAFFGSRGRPFSGPTAIPPPREVWECWRLASAAGCVRGHGRGAVLPDHAQIMNIRLTGFSPSLVVGQGCRSGDPSQTYRIGRPGKDTGI